IFLLLLVAGLGGFIAFWEVKQPDTKARLTMEVRPFAFTPAEVDLVEVVTKDETTRLLRKGDEWSIGQPFEDRADPDLVKKLLDSILDLEWLETVERKDMRREDFRRTGLVDSAVEVTVRKGGRSVAQCRLGAAAPIEGAFYLSRPAENDELHLAKTTLPEIVRRSATDWRDPRLLRLKAEDVERFAISAGSGGMEFSRKPGQMWQLVKPLETRASDDRVTAVLASVLSLKATAAKGAVPAPDAGADLPVMTIALSGGRIAPPVQLTLYPNVDASAEVHAAVSDRRGLFLAKARANDYWKLLPNHLRDQNLARIPSGAVVEVRIRSANFGEVVLDRKADTWLLSRFGKQEPANQQRVKKLFDTLNTAQVRDFLSDTASSLAPFGLEVPLLTVEWTIGEKRTAMLFGQATDGTLTAKQSDEPFIYRVGSSVLNSLPPDSVRWRGTRVVDASIFAVRRIIIAEGDRPSITLHYDADNGTFTAHTAGRDVTAQLDTASANQLLQKLVNFEVADWSSDRSAALATLRNPSLTVQILLADPAAPNADAVPLTLSFAPTQPGMDTALYHGRRDGEPDTFLLSREAYRALLVPLLK
ncbi:MAG: DUF4340 domain-containing protein, partial [Roseimicrobium sp.]